MRRRIARAISGAILVALLPVLLISCGGTQDSATPTQDSATPTKDAEAFVGTGSCTMSTTSMETLADGTTEIREHFSCTLETSDERVSGTQELDTVTVVPATQTVGTAKSLLWWTEKDVIVTDSGTWRAIDGYGVVDMVGVHPLAERVAPFNYGVQHYVGEKDHSGLQLTIIYAGTNESGALAGWLQES